MTMIRVSDWHTRHAARNGPSLLHSFDARTKPTETMSNRTTERTEQHVGIFLDQHTACVCWKHNVTSGRPATEAADSPSEIDGRWRGRRTHFSCGMWNKRIGSFSSFFFCEKNPCFLPVTQVAERCSRPFSSSFGRTSCFDFKLSTSVIMHVVIFMLKCHNKDCWSTMATRMH